MLNYGKINFSVIIKIYDRATSLIDKQNWYEIKKKLDRERDFTRIFELITCFTLNFN
jgi:hypothetical protein